MKEKKIYFEMIETNVIKPRLLALNDLQLTFSFLF